MSYADDLDRFLNRGQRAQRAVDDELAKHAASIPILAKGRYRLANGSIVRITELEGHIAVGHIEDSQQVYTYAADTGETSVRSYRTVEYVGVIAPTAHPETPAPSSQDEANKKESL